MNRQFPLRCVPTPPPIEVLAEGDLQNGERFRVHAEINGQDMNIVLEVNEGWCKVSMQELAEFVAGLGLTTPYCTVILEPVRVETGDTGGE